MGGAPTKNLNPALAAVAATHPQARPFVPATTKRTAIAAELPTPSHMHRRRLFNTDLKLAAGRAFVAVNSKQHKHTLTCTTWGEVERPHLNTSSVSQAHTLSKQIPCNAVLTREGWTGAQAPAHVADIPAASGLCSAQGTTEALAGQAQDRSLLFPTSKPPAQQHTPNGGLQLRSPVPGYW